MGAQTENSELIKRTFGKYLAMSILITLSATLGMMIDNVIAGNLLGSGAVAAIGMSLSVFMLFSGCAGILETGAVALCARALGNRDADRVNVLFSVSLAAALAVGAALSVGGVAGADVLATMLGAASGELHADTAAYLSGICSGAFAIVLLQLLMGFTRLDNAPQLGIVAIVGMSVCGVVFNLVAVCVLDLGLRGMGLATALAYCVAVGICCTHFPSKHNTLHLVNPVPHAGQLAGVLKTGLPDSLTRATVMVRTFAFDWLLLTVASAGAVAALSMLSSVNSFASSVTIGVGQTATLLCGIFFGEEDRGALKGTLRTGMRMGLVLSCALCAAVFAFAPQVVGLFGLEGDAEAFGVVAVRAFILCVPIDLINQLFVNYYQGTGNVRAASAIAVGQSGLFAVLFALGTVWFWGATAVWTSFLVGEVVTLALQLVVASVLWRRRVAKGAAAGAAEVAANESAAPAIAGDRDGIAAGGAAVDKATLLDKMMYLPETFQADWRAGRLAGVRLVRLRTDVRGGRGVLATGGGVVRKPRHGRAAQLPRAAGGGGNGRQRGRARLRQNEAPGHRREAHLEARRHVDAAHARQRRGVQSDGPGPFRCRPLFCRWHSHVAPRRARSGVPEHGGAQQRGGDVARRFPIGELSFSHATWLKQGTKAGCRFAFPAYLPSCVPCSHFRVFK